MKQFKSFVFPETIKKQIDSMNDAMKLKFYIAVTNYGMYDEAPTDFNDIENIVWISMRDLLDNCKSSKGGAPLGNNNASKTKNNQNNQNNQKTTKTTLNNDNHNLNYNYNDNVNDRERENEKFLEKSENEIKNTLSSDFSNQNNQDFVIPTQKEVVEYCKKEKLGVNPYIFFDFYASKNWIVGKSKMTDWHASIRLWESRNNAQNLSTSYSQKNTLLVNKSPQEIETQEKAFELYSQNLDLSLDECLKLAKKEVCTS